MLTLAETQNLKFQSGISRPGHDGAIANLFEEIRARQLFFHPRQRFDCGVTANGSQDLAFAHAIGFIDLQKIHGGLTKGIGGLDTNAVKLEALGPSVGAGMEQAGEFRTLADEGAKVAAFAVVAAGARPSEIRQFRRAFVLPADDVIDLTAPERVVLMEEAILADVEARSATC